ncbi:MAG: STAS domain-containing protein [Gemmatimonadetes bacterium]|nr:STAS domain-containing protein [Gemmatimonadota bacterium]
MTDRRPARSSTALRRPKLLSVLSEGYTRTQFLADLQAGVIVGIVALPLAIAFAIASGVTPDRGLATAVVAGFLISALGGSRVQIGGPTGAFVVIVYGIVQQHGVDGLLLATMMAGVILVAMGYARLGAVIKFIPYPVTIGFTAGIAVIIFTSQVRDLLGLATGALPADFIGKVTAYAEHAGSVNGAAVLLAVATIAIILLWQRVPSRIPGPFVALLATTALVPLLGLQVETIGSRFGVVHGLPMPSVPHVVWADIPRLFPSAITIALLAAIESLLSAVVADGMIGTRHRSDQELIAQGVANFVSPFFGGMPATGAIARTATNVKNGGRTPVAGIVHALTLLLIALIAGRWAALIPMATLGGILAVVCWHMGEWHVVRRELRGPRSDAVVMGLTFLLTVLIDLTVAVQAGVILAAFLFMRRMADVTHVTAWTGDDEEDAGDPNTLATRQVPPGVEVYEVNGPFFFGAAGKFRDTLAAVSRRPRVLVIRMRSVPAIDATGLHALREVIEQTGAEGTRVILSDVHAQPMAALARTELLERLGDENIVGHIDEALALARRHLGLPEAPNPVHWAPTVARQERRKQPRER